MNMITSQQEWSVAIAQVVELLAACNEFQFNQERAAGTPGWEGIENDMQKLIPVTEENASACGLFEMVAEKIQERKVASFADKYLRFFINQKFQGATMPEFSEVTQYTHELMAVTEEDEFFCNLVAQKMLEIWNEKFGCYE